VPLQAVFHEGPTAYVYVPQGSGFAQRKVTVGEASELHMEVSSGLVEGDVVLLREPHPAEIVARLDKAEGPEGWQRPGNGKGPTNRASADQKGPRRKGEVTHKPGEKRPPAQRPAPSGDRPSAEG
ncbi:MAG: hypothetical protein O6941_06445, partial [Planctomycetota bacterium]|nr:hypothetical protein [Planctomycetota bacterium]